MVADVLPKDAEGCYSDKIHSVYIVSTLVSCVTLHTHAKIQYVTHVHVKVGCTCTKYTRYCVDVSHVARMGRSILAVTYDSTSMSSVSILEGECCREK